MLKSLKVKNYALISDIHLEFASGLNIITGETGAGKSILIEALGLVLGRRADSSALRNQEHKCVIEAEFHINKRDSQAFFEQHNLDHDSETIVRREITPSGKTRMFINDTPVNLKVLELFGRNQVEIHSQYDNLQLFKDEFQYQILDNASHAIEVFDSYTKLFDAFKSNSKELNLLREREGELIKEKEFNQFLFDELEQAGLESLNESGLEKELMMLENAEALIQDLQAASQLLNEGEFNASSQLQALKSRLDAGGALTEALSERLGSLLIELQDIAAEVDQMAAEVEVNPDRLEVVNSQLAALFQLKSKHRVQDVAGLLELRELLQEKLLETSDLTGRIAELELGCKEQESQLYLKAIELHELRAKGIDGLTDAINTGLASVGMPHSKIQIVLQKAELGSFGANTIHFELSSDNGKHFTALKKAASGGELSRINLVVKKQMIGNKSLPSSVMDEIDTGVSGEIARKVGGFMHEMADEQQLIVITHLPQIASMGSRHFHVYKEVLGEMVITAVKQLESDQRVHEIAKMISGDNLTESALEQSKELLKP